MEYYAEVLKQGDTTILPKVLAQLKRCTLLCGPTPRGAAPPRSKPV